MAILRKLHACVHCGKLFTSDLRGTQFCSVACADADPRLRRRPWETKGKPCSRCGRPRLIYASGTRTSYCRACRNQVARESMRRKRVKAMDR